MADRIPSRLHTIGVYGSILSLLIAMALFAAMTWRDHTPQAMHLLLLAPLLCFWLLYAVGKHLTVSRLERHDWHVCLHCHYPLPAGPDEGTCPECGDRYSKEATARVWTDRYYPKFPSTSA